jgi:hypothetical protein
LGKADWAATRTYAREGAPLDRRGGPRTVVLYSPGVLDPRSLGTTLCDDLASLGYAVVAIDHTYEVGRWSSPVAGSRPAGCSTSPDLRLDRADGEDFGGPGRKIVVPFPTATVSGPVCKASVTLAWTDLTENVFW